MHDRPTSDRRVQKTRTLLVEALSSLIHEKPYDAIAVREILTRANVGRSTFYTHFRDKDALLIGGITDVLRTSSVSAPESRACSERVTEFSLPILEHIDRHRHSHDGLMNSGSRKAVHERLRRVLTKRIGDAVKNSLQGGAPAPDAMPPDLLVRHVIATFFVVLDWWVDNQSRLSPREVNDVFRALVLPALRQALD